MSEEIIYKYLALSYANELTLSQSLKIIKDDPTLANLSLNLTLNLTSNGKKCDNNDKTIEADLKWCQEKYHHILTYNDPRYPRLLKEIATPPLLLFVKGDPAVLSSPQIAIVGSRKASVYGCNVAANFATELAQHGMVITSGLALGIDGVAHKSAIESGRTIAVLGSGLENIYPNTHRNLASNIINNGALVSEFPLHCPPNKYNFPRRNRIISGLSLGVLVVEASSRSGSIITAKEALEQNREVFVIPNGIYNANYTGCHALIRQGAKLVDCVSHILEEFVGPTNLLNCIERGTKPVFTNGNSRINASGITTSRINAGNTGNAIKINDSLACVNGVDNDTTTENSINIAPNINASSIELVTEHNSLNNTLFSKLSLEYLILMEQIKNGFVTMEELSVATKFEINQLNAMLTYLELEGYIGLDSGSYIVLR